jgi:hypothetical protein
MTLRISTRRAVAGSAASNVASRPPRPSLGYAFGVACRPLILLDAIRIRPSDQITSQ